MSDAFAHLPFLSAGAVQAGSFTLFEEEDAQMNFVWRVRSSYIYTITPVVWSYSGTEYPILDIAEGQASIEHGSGPSTGAFTSPDDILCDWRATTYAMKTLAIPPSLEGDATITWGPTGDYEQFADAYFGALTSNFRLDVISLGDVPLALDSTPNDGWISTGVAIATDPSIGGGSVQLFMNDVSANGTAYEEARFSGGPIFIKPWRWWPHDIAEEATWNEFSGEQLRDPKRRDNAGHNLIYFAQAES